MCDNETVLIQYIKRERKKMKTVERDWVAGAKNGTLVLSWVSVELSSLFNTIENGRGVAASENILSKDNRKTNGQHSLSSTRDSF